MSHQDLVVGREVALLAEQCVYTETWRPVGDCGCLKASVKDGLEGADPDIDVPIAWFERRQRTRGVAEFVWRVMLAER